MSKQKKSLIIGLTGQTGAGKTTVTEFFEQNGMGIVNCDLIARDVLANNNDCKNEIITEFGETVLDQNKNINRKALGAIVFADKHKLDKLNRITHPYIIQQSKQQIKEHIKNNKMHIILDAPTLFESGADKICDVIISVISAQDIRIERIIKRDNITKQQALARINSQLDEQFFIENSDYIISNNSIKKDLIKQLNHTLSFIKGLKYDEKT